MNLFQCQLGPVVPVSVVEMLSDQRVRLNGEVRIYLLTTANTALSYYDPRRLVVEVSPVSRAQLMTVQKIQQKMSFSLPVRRCL